MTHRMRWSYLIKLILLCMIHNALSDVPHKKFEYKYSFKPPYLAQKDGSIPFWEFGGNAIPSSENIRIAPSLRSQKGAIWTKQPTNFEWWEIDFIFRITGRGRIGADGLAFWYTTTKGLYNGTVFGSSDNWIGLGIFFDSFDNDNKHNNPHIYAITNDGTKMFDHSNDGGTLLGEGCLRDFRNKPFPTRAKIEYFKNSLTLLFHGGMTNNEQDYEVCFRLENVNLPKVGFFGISAATGGLADDHDVIHFLTTSLRTFTDEKTNNADVLSEEDKKLSKEYQDYQKKLEQQKEEYRRDHPNDKPEKEDFEEWFESDNERELRQIFSGLSQISDGIRLTNKKLDEILGRQERSLSLISQIQVKGLQEKVDESKLQNVNTIQRYEIDTILNTQNSILSASNEITVFTKDINTKIDLILSSQSKTPMEQVQSLGYDYQSIINEMREGVNSLKREILQANSNIKNTKSVCPTDNCLTITMFLLVIAIQSAIFLSYNIYKNSKEAQAKKFY